MVEINSILGERDHERGAIACVGLRDRESVKEYIEGEFGENVLESILLFEYGRRQDAKGWIIRTDTRLIFYINQDMNDFVKYDYIKWQIDELTEINSELVVEDNVISVLENRDIVFDTQIISANRLKREIERLILLTNIGDSACLEEDSNPIDKLLRLSRKFHSVATQLSRRYSSRETLVISDEYDVQDLYHSLLKIFFEDVRPEENTPSFGGHSSRTDFLLKDEKIIIEIKKTRSGLTDREITDQLVLDYRYYQAHPDCEKLFCFIYDPEHLISNREGLKRDLEGMGNENVPIKIFFSP